MYYCVVGRSCVLIGYIGYIGYRGCDLGKHGAPEEAPITGSVITIDDLGKRYETSVIETRMRT
jgi:hypothetical protein